MTATMKIVLWVGIIVALAAFLVFGGDKVMYFKHIIAPAYFASSAGDNSLLAENTALRAELEKLLYIKDAVTHFKPEFLGAAVYSQYPFSSKNEIAVGVGSANGVRIGMPVIAGDILFGVIRNIYPNYSVAVTVFDNSFEIPVKIGDSGVDGLFMGGAVPKVTLIPHEAKIATGDAVYSASADTPYGLPLGSISGINEDKGGAWKAADLMVPYNISNLRAVSVITNYKQ